MHRIDTPNSKNGKFANGNANQGVKGTEVDASWLNSVQEEISSTIESADISLDKEKDNQLLQAIKKIVKSTLNLKEISGSFEGTLGVENTLIKGGIPSSYYDGGCIVDLTISVSFECDSVNDVNVIVKGEDADFAIFEHTFKVKSGTQSIRFSKSFARGTAGGFGVYASTSSGLISSCKVVVSGITAVNS